VLDLHAPFVDHSRTGCAHCCEDDYAFGFVAYPCQTVSAIADALGLTRTPPTSKEQNR
jgi:hypothetical protein